MANHKINPREINKLLDQKHVDAFVQAYQQAFGERSSLAYTGESGVYTSKQGSELLKILRRSSKFSELSEKIQAHLNDAPVDFFRKDLAMIVLQPIGLAIEGSLQTIIGLIQVLSSIPAAVQKKDHDMLLGMSQIWLGVSILLLAAVAPLARMFHAATRAYASVVEPKSKDQVLKHIYGGVDLFNDQVDRALEEHFSRAKDSDDNPTTFDCLSKWHKKLDDEFLYNLTDDDSDDEDLFTDNPRAELLDYIKGSNEEHSDKKTTDDSMTFDYLSKLDKMLVYDSDDESQFTADSLDDNSDDESQCTDNPLDDDSDDEDPFNDNQGAGLLDYIKGSNKKTTGDSAEKVAVYKNMARELRDENSKKYPTDDSKNKSSFD